MARTFPAELPPAPEALGAPPPTGLPLSAEESDLAMQEVKYCGLAIAEYGSGYMQRRVDPLTVIAEVTDVVDRLVGWLAYAESTLFDYNADQPEVLLAHTHRHKTAEVRAAENA